MHTLLCTHEALQICPGVSPVPARGDESLYLAFISPLAQSALSYPEQVTGFTYGEPSSSA